MFGVSRAYPYTERWSARRVSILINIIFQGGGGLGVGLGLQAYKKSMDVRINMFFGLIILSISCGF